MAEGATIANAFVQIMPSMDGATNNITQAILPSMSTAGTQAGATFGGMFTGKLGTVLKGAGAAVIGYLAFDTLKDAFVEVEEGYHNVIKATGATGEAAQQLKEVYLDVSKSVVGSYADIGSAVGELNTRFGLQGQALEEASEQAMKYAKVTGQDATAAIRDVSRLMNNAGIDASEYAHVLDVLTVAAQQSGIDVGKLATSVTENAASFRELGFSTEESIAMLASFEKAGVNTSQVLAGMKKGVANWAKEGKSAAQGFQDFVQGIQEGSITSADAIELFGARAGVAMYDAASRGQLSFDDMYKAISEGSDGALDEVYKSTLTAEEKFNLLGQKVQTGFYEIMEPIVDAIEPYMDDIIEAVGDAVEWIVDIAVPAVKATIEDIQRKIQWLSDTFGPILEAVMEFVNGVVEGWTWLSEQTDALFSGIHDTIANELNDAKTVGSETVKTFTSAMNGDWDEAARHATTAFETLKNNITSKLTAAKNFVINAAETIGNWLGFPGLGAKVNSVFESIGQFMKNPIENAKNFIAGIPGQIVSFFSGLGASISNAIGSIYFPSPHIWWEDLKVGPLSVPLPHVSWYAQGGFLDEATIIGAGEAGPEMVLPKQGKLMDEFTDTIASKIGGRGVDIHDCTFYVREEDDVRKVAVQLNSLINRQLVGGIA